jgi:hypothetical protein
MSHERYIRHQTRSFIFPYNVCSTCFPSRFSDDRLQLRTEMRVGIHAQFPYCCPILNTTGICHRRLVELGTTKYYNMLIKFRFVPWGQTQQIFVIFVANELKTCKFIISLKQTSDAHHFIPPTYQMVTRSYSSRSVSNSFPFLLTR